MDVLGGLSPDGADGVLFLLDAGIPALVALGLGGVDEGGLAIEAHAATVYHGDGEGDGYAVEVLSGLHVVKTGEKHPELPEVLDRHFLDLDLLTQYLLVGVLLTQNSLGGV